MFTLNKLVFVHFYGRNIKYLKEYHGKCIKNDLKIKFDVNFHFHDNIFQFLFPYCTFLQEYNFNSYHL
jgi:hypothetical protein